MVPGKSLRCLKQLRELPDDLPVESTGRDRAEKHPLTSANYAGSVLRGVVLPNRGRVPPAHKDHRHADQNHNGLRKQHNNNMRANHG